MEKDRGAGAGSARTDTAAATRRLAGLSRLSAALSHGVWVLIAAALVHWTFLWFKVPILIRLRGWFWPFRDKPLQWWWLLPMLLATVSALWWLTRRHRTGGPRSGLAFLAIAVLLGFTLQTGFALLEGRGLDGMRDRMVSSGHAEFASIAVQQDDTLATIRNYEARLETGELGHYARSKPPGTLLLYMATDRVASVFRDPGKMSAIREAGSGGDADEATERAEWLRTFASVSWPLLSYWVLVPLFALGCMLFDRQRAETACLLFLAVPSVNLITLHTDQVFFPFCFVTSLLLPVLALRVRPALSPGLGAAAGVFTYLAVFCTFPLALALPVAFAVNLAQACAEGDRRAAWTRFLGTWLGILAGLGVTDVLFRTIVDYDILFRFQTAVEHHQQWKKWTPGVQPTLYFAVLNALEFALWTGLPISLLAIAHARGSVDRMLLGRMTPATALSAAALGAILVLLLVGKTKGEVARLWLFLVPVVCLLAADRIHRAFARTAGWMVFGVLALQWGTVLLIKRFQDFF